MAKVSLGIIVIYSGGMDSFTVLHKVLQNHSKEHVQAISFAYGQRHSRELLYADVEAARLGIKHQIVSLKAIRSFIQGSALTSSDVDVPEGHYEAESMKATVVPGRNTFMLALAMAYAESQLSAYEHMGVWYGAHSGDHHIYPDCRPSYVKAMQRVYNEATEHKVSLCAPYLNQNKIDILRDGFQMGLNYANTWTCYKGLQKPCGVCGACQERAEAFAAHGVADPALANKGALT